MGVKITNNARTFLTTGLTNSATTIVVDDTVAFPDVSAENDYFYATLYNADGDVEIVKVNSTDANSMTVERAQQDTDPAGWGVNDNIELRLTAGTLTEFIQQLPPNLDIATGRLPFGKLFVAEAPTANSAYMGYDPTGINPDGNAEGVFKWRNHAEMARGMEALEDADKLDYLTGLKNKPSVESSGGGSGLLGYSTHDPVSIIYPGDGHRRLVLRSANFLTHSHFAIAGGASNGRSDYTIARCADFRRTSQYYAGAPPAGERAYPDVGRDVINIGGRNVAAVVVFEDEDATEGKLYISGGLVYLRAIDFFDFT